MSKMDAIHAFGRALTHVGRNETKLASAAVRDGIRIADNDVTWFRHWYGPLADRLVASGATLDRGVVPETLIDDVSRANSILSTPIL